MLNKTAQIFDKETLLRCEITIIAPGGKYEMICSSKK